MPADPGSCTGPTFAEGPESALADGPKATFKAAVAAWRAGEHEWAVRTMEDIVEGRRGPVGAKLRRKILPRLLSFVSRLDWSETERIARRTTELFPEDSFGHRHLGEALFRQGRTIEAQAELETAIRLDPEDGEARMLLMVARRPGVALSARRQVRTWPDRQPAFDDPRNLLERYLLRGYPNRPIIGPDTSFLTLGSCFATNLAGRLGAQGYVVTNEPIGEEVNSTYANHHLLRWTERGPVDKPTQVIEDVFGSARRERLLKAIQTSDVLVLTLGVAPCFFDRETGEFAFATLASRTNWQYAHTQLEMRTTSVAENVENIERIHSIAERVRGRPIHLVLTVSPVSLAGTSEHYSAIVADCLSKSTLRLACEIAIQKRPDLIYWPAFEIVRWIGVHYTRPDAPVFGAEDGSTRHVSNWLVDLIVELFISHHWSGDEPRTEAGGG